MVACTVCGAAVHGGEAVFGRPYHSECITCVDCKKRIGLTSGNMWEAGRSGGIRCNDCHQQSLPTCGGCGEQILEEKILSYEGAPYHGRCFTCRSCSRPIEGKFVKDNGHVFCSQQCYRSQTSGSAHSSPPSSHTAADQEFQNALRTPSCATASGLQQVFQRFDVDGNGVISPAELRAVLALLPVPQGSKPFGEASLDRLIDIIDENNDGVIDYHEFADWLCHDGEGAHEILKRMKTPGGGERPQSRASRPSSSGTTRPAAGQRVRPKDTHLSTNEILLRRNERNIR